MNIEVDPSGLGGMSSTASEVGAGSGERTGTELAVGVGPWPGPWPHGPEAVKYDPELLRDGDRRNVLDQYRYWRHEAIVADLDTRRHELHVAVENWEHDFNIGSIIRTANAFNVAAFHIVGRRRWNRRGAMVTDRYQHEQHHPDVASLVAWAEAEGVAIVAVDNVPGSVPIESYEMPRRCILLFGSEGPGLTADALEAARDIVHITQYGSTRSINAGAAAAIAMHSWIRVHATTDEAELSPVRGPGHG